MHPILGTARAHLATDYGAPTGSPVVAVANGTVTFAGWDSGYGNLVRIKHPSGLTSGYAHLSKIAAGVRAGAVIRHSELVGLVGMTGLATGPHLHYEYRVNGVFRNPQTVALPEAEPLDARWRSDFLARSAPLLASLEEPLGPALVAR